GFSAGGFSAGGFSAGGFSAGGFSVGGFSAALPAEPVGEVTALPDPVSLGGGTVAAVPLPLPSLGGGTTAGCPACMPEPSPGLAMCSCGGTLPSSMRDSA